MPINHYNYDDLYSPTKVRVPGMYLFAPVLLQWLHQPTTRRGLTPRVVQQLAGTKPRASGPHPNQASAPHDIQPSRAPKPNLLTSRSPVQRSPNVVVEVCIHPIII